MKIFGAVKAYFGDWIQGLLSEKNRLLFLNHVEKGHVIMGRHSYGAPIIHWDKRSSSIVHIGRYCSIAYDVNILTGGNHNTQWVSTYPHRVMFDIPGKYTDGHPCSKGDVHIGNDVWIAHGATILSGVHIGHGAVVACRSVVTKNVEPYTIVGGIPARPLRQRFSTAEISALLAIQWWNWPDEKVKEAIPLLCSDDIGEFIKCYRKDAGMDITGIRL